ncbi:MAG: DUF4435 domain-containing protein [Cyanobacteria bacterium P01_D01_bin.156]
MSNLIYSGEARNVLNLFHRVEKMLYVEGDDDILFWEFVFQKLSRFSVRIEEVGGKEEIKKYIDEVISGQANYLIAIDSDFDKLISRQYHHTNIISTFGYSIENTIITNSVINKLLRTVCRVQDRDIPENLSQEWLYELEKKVSPLILYAIINDEEKLGHAVIPSNSDRFMKSKNSCELCEQKINSYLDNLPIEISKEQQAKIYTNLGLQGLKILDVILGHFLMSAAFRLIKVKTEELRTSVSISKEMFFNSLFLAFESMFDPTHPHYDYYKVSIDSVVFEDHRSPDVGTGNPPDTAV